MIDDEIELRILRSYVEQHRAAELADPVHCNKCARELDMRQVIAEITGESGSELEYALHENAASRLHDHQRLHISRSFRSFSFPSFTVCHCILPGLSGPSAHSGSMWSTT